MVINAKENQYRDLEGPSTEKKENLEVPKSTELTGALLRLEEINTRLMRDQPINVQAVAEVREALGTIAIDVGGEKISLREISEIPNFKKTWELFKDIKDGLPVNTAELTFITPSIAKKIIRQREASAVTHTLFLDGIRRLSDESARELSAYHGKIFFKDLEELSETAAGYLTSGNVESLYLKGPTILSDAALDKLANLKGVLELGGIKKMSDRAAKILGRHNDNLYLAGLSGISAAGITELANHNGQVLDLSGLESLTPEAAKLLSAHRHQLKLEGIKTISDEALEALMGHQGESLEMSLPGELTPSRAKILVKYTGALNLKDVDFIGLEAAQILLQHQSRPEVEELLRQQDDTKGLNFESLKRMPEEAFRLLEGKVEFFSPSPEIKKYLERAESPSAATS